MLLTSRRSIPFPNPDRSDHPDIPLHFGYLAAALDLDVLFTQGTNAARIAAAHQPGGGLFWYVTDTGLVWYDDGAVWHLTGAQNLIGTYSARPAANAVAASSQYTATDTLGRWQSDGSTWTLISQGMPTVSLAAFGGAPWTTPYDGMMASLEIDLANGVRWQIRYNAGSSSGFKWEFQGGPPLYSAVETAESLSSTSYVGLTTPGPSITVPRAGDYDVSIGFNASNWSVWMSYDVGAASATDADAALDAATVHSVTRAKRKTALTISTALVAKYKESGGTSNPQNRWMYVTPIRIS